MSNVTLKNFFDDEYQLLIDGEWTKGSAGKTLESRNPSNGEYLSKFIDATAEDVDAAVAAATKAFETWSQTTIQQRSELLLKIADLIDENTDRLATVETYDNGKPLRETKAVDVPLASDHFRYFAGVIRAEEGSVALIDQDTWSLVIKEPIGVVGQIIPWNFPLLMAAWKLAPALATGNTIVIHPSSSTSLSMLEFGKLLNQVLPKGVVNIITGKGSVSGEYMLHHEGFNKLAFTGSTEVGYKVAKAAADKLIPATLELGGKSANIFFDDMDIDQALEGAQLGILFNQGQVCCAGSRIFVQEGIYDKFIAGLKKAFEDVKVGMPWEDGVQMGAQVNQSQLNKILDYVRIGKEEGAEVLAGGVQLTDGELGKGVFMAPTLMGNATNDMRISQEEIFGPVATVIKFKTEEDVIKMANDSEYGLGGGVWTRDLNRALRVSKAIRTGRVWVNTYNQIPAGAPFGGYKKSGIGRETDKSILEAYTQTKNIFISTKESKLGLY
ncbi:MAG: aldehyde dehydrogenase [Clostridiales bacterium]|jgi:acyl-CoA reductase-like NAD-dependent aldehyde dehydrogenase|nr:aldehyde dehydrogenase [Clostridiales bacterium]